MNPIAQSIYIAIGKLQLRSDVTVDRLTRVGCQAIKKLGLPPHLAELYEDIGALDFYWRFNEPVDRPGTGGINLRGPAAAGWWDASCDPPVALLFRDGEWMGYPGQEVIIVHGQEEGGVLMTKDGQLAFFNSDGETAPIDADLAWLAAGPAVGFAHGWDSPRGPQTETVERLQKEVGRRKTITATVTKLDTLEGDAARAWLLGGWSAFEFGAVTKALKVKGNYRKLSQEERGLLLIDALGDAAALDAKTRKAVLSPFKGKATVAALQERFLLGEVPRLTRGTMTLEFLTKGAKRFALGRTLVARALLDVGVIFPDTDADVIRFVPNDHAQLATWLPVVSVLSKVRGKPPTAELEFTLLETASHALEAGQSWASSAIEPLELL